MRVFAALLASVALLAGGVSAAQAAVVTQPGAPVVFDVVAGDASLDVSAWAPGSQGSRTSDGGGAITGYQYSLNAGPWENASGVSTDSSGKVTLSIGGLSNGTRYSVRLRAENSAGPGQASVAYVPKTPKFPTPVITMLFGSKDTDSGSAVLAGQVRLDAVTAVQSWSVSVAGGPTQPLTVQGNGPVYDFAFPTDAAPSASALVTITATPTNGTATSTSMSAYIPALATPAFAPLSVEGSGPQAVARIPWLASADITNLTNLQWSYEAGFGYTSTGAELNLDGTIDVPLASPGYDYSIFLRAHDGTGFVTLGRYTNVVPAGVPSRPVVYGLVAGLGKVSFRFTAALPNGSPLTDYEYSVNGSDWASLNTRTAGNPAVVSGLTPGVAYTVQVRAVNGVGAGPASVASASFTPGQTINNVFTVNRYLVNDASGQSQCHLYSVGLTGEGVVVPAGAVIAIEPVGVRITTLKRMNQGDFVSGYDCQGGTVATVSSENVASGTSVPFIGTATSELIELSGPAATGQVTDWARANTTSLTLVSGTIDVEFATAIANVPGLISWDVKPKFEDKNQIATCAGPQDTEFTCTMPKRKNAWAPRPLVSLNPSVTVNPSLPGERPRTVKLFSQTSAGYIDRPTAVGVTIASAKPTQGSSGAFFEVSVKHPAAAPLLWGQVANQVSRSMTTVTASESTLQVARGQIFVSQLVSLGNGLPDAWSLPIRFAWDGKGNLLDSGQVVTAKNVKKFSKTRGSTAQPRR